MAAMYLDGTRLAGRVWDDDTTDRAIGALAALESVSDTLDDMETALRAVPTEHDDANEAQRLYMQAMDMRECLSALIERLVIRTGNENATRAMLDARY